jgi:hypothetical protein
MLDKNNSFIGSVPEFYERYLVPMHFERMRGLWWTGSASCEQDISWRSLPALVQ